MSEFTLAKVEPPESHSEIASKLTVELALYAAIAIFAFFIRFFFLDAVPLNSEEARRAIASWNFVHGGASVVTDSPLLFTLNTVLFALFGASDFTARLAPAFFGTVLVLLPAFFRRDLGRVGALVASTLLALSPSIVFFSRTLDGVIPGVTCALAAIAFASRYIELRAARDLRWAAAAAAFALLAAPDVWTIVLALVLYYAFASRLGLLGRLNNQPIHAGNPKPLALFLFVLVFVGVSTTFLLNRQGVGAGFDLFAAWLASLRLGGSPIGVIRLLVVYEPLVALFGLFALLDIIFTPEKNRIVLCGVLGFWFATAFLLLSLNPDNNPAHIVVTVLPLALLAGSNIGAWIEHWVNEIRVTSIRDLLMHETPILAVSVGLMSFLLIVLAELAQRGNILTADVLVRLVGSSRENSEVGSTIFVMLFLVAFTATSALAVTTLGIKRAKNIGVLFAACILSIWTIRQMTMLNFPYGGAFNPQEWMVARAASPNVRDLISDLEDASRWRANDTHTLAIVADSSLGPMLEWNLRDFKSTRFAQRPATAPSTQAFILSANAPAPAEGWIAQRYQIERTLGIARVSTLRALIFRDVGNIDSTDAVLWVPKP